jgi:L-rhamnose-H+ transport protein
MNEQFFPVVLVILASVFQGTFGLGMKHIKPLAWEAWWLVYALVAMVVVPVAWAAATVPDLAGAISAAPGGAVLGGMFYGFLWGIGGILFGVSVFYIGMSLTYGIVMGLAGSVGSLTPLLFARSAISTNTAALVGGGVAVMLAGVGLVAWAGLLRDRAAAGGTSIEGVRRGSEFHIGLAIAIASGVLSALLNVGFANATPVAQTAAQRGAAVRNSSLAAWVVVLAGAFLMNLLYSVFLLSKNRSWQTLRPNASTAGPFAWALITGLLWFAALGVYGQGAALMGPLGPVIGWPILLGLALIVSNAWAVRAGEWRNAGAAFRVMLAGVAVLIVACVVLGYSNSLPRL